MFLIRSVKIRLMKTPIKMIWDILVVQLEKPGRVAFDCHKLMRKLKCESVRRYKEIYKNSKRATGVRYA